MQGSLRLSVSPPALGSIPDPQFRSRDPRFATQGRHKAKATGNEPIRFTLAHFSYDEASDTYRCPKGKVLRLEAAAAYDGRGNAYRRYQSRVEDCARCPLRKGCLQRNARQRSLHVPKPDDTTATLTRAMRTKIDLPESRTIYSRRLAIVEPVFANIRIQKGMNRFTYRGKAKVNTQWLLFCLVHNLERVAHYGSKWLQKAVEKAWRASCAASTPFLCALQAAVGVLLALFVTCSTTDDRAPLLAEPA